jgi:hypothetical protein
MYLKARISVLVFVLAVCAPVIMAQAARQNVAPAVDAIECRILEAHASATPPVLLVIFHQRDKKDQPHLAELLKEKTGGMAQVQLGGSPWTKVTVFRLKSSFGRGLLVLPAGSLEMKNGGTFRIRFSSAGAGD